MLLLLKWICTLTFTSGFTRVGMINRLKKGVVGDAMVKEVEKCFKGNTIKKMVRTFCRSILMMELALLDKDICEYLLYLLLSMQLAMAKPLKTLDTLLIQTNTNEEWVKEWLYLARKTSAYYRDLPEI